MPMIPVFHVSVSSHLHSRIAKKLNTHKCLVFLGIHLRQINKSRKYKQQLLLRKLRPRLSYACTPEIYSKGFPFYTSQIHKNSIFFSLKGLLSLIPSVTLSFFGLLIFKPYSPYFLSAPTPALTFKLKLLF